jgi:hypothetical protein
MDAVGLIERVPEGTLERNTFSCMLLHPVERAIFANRVPLRLVDDNAEERREAPHLPRRAILPHQSAGGWTKSGCLTSKMLFDVA